MTVFFTVLLTFLCCLVISSLIFMILLKKEIVDTPPNRLAHAAFIGLTGFSLFFAVTVPSLVMYFAAITVNHFFGEYIIYGSLSDLYIFSVVVSILALVYMLILTAIVKGMTHVLTLPAWSAYILEFIFAWAAVYFSIQYVSNHIIENISIFQGGEILLSLFITFLFSGLDILFTNLDKITKEKLG
ncbi:MULTISPECIES: hypothetical protein [Bacillus amyloliquefaciens group]|uniref:hypothetical protein n=1 Tax=Bacillus amyloliquefaciens group TaxID=1938374 RepID=UPI00077D7CCF|nr:MULTISPECIES: hypothetical protein [Bacillus amyloliquefaciens group]AMQ71592.1 hypothetical protein BAMY6639_13605 [Bacillus amyloliquefaciens UMAF6639]MCB7144368.1 hypothetical protein [Bacillus velezensis]MCC2533036.1 hypothetical protein [Bacillus velezensis]MCC2551906.1 hypothetical protein [Bacillus velezensis]